MTKSGCQVADLYLGLATPVYVARTDDACVDVGKSLEVFVEDLCQRWEAGGGDVAVWMADRPVAVLREGLGGKPSVTWL
jgi:hypothetical protein